MSKSIMQARRECYVCRELYGTVTTAGLEEHHVFGGPLRGKSERYGLKVWLCADHHRRQNGYSAHFDRGLADWLHGQGQLAFMEQYGADLWLREFWRIY